LDNADNKLDFFSGNDGNSAAGLFNYIPQTSKGAIVLTTRDYEVACQLAGPSGVLKKEAMGPSDAAALFKQLYPSVSTSYDEDCTMELLQELQFLPLAVTQVASYLEMNRSMITPSEYLRTFKRTKEGQRRLLSKATHNSWRSDKLRSSQNAETVLTTFSITFQQIQNQSPLAYLILRTIACIDSRGIPRGLLATLDGADDDIQLGEALSKLQNFSLLHKVTTHEFTGDSYTVHSLVHLAIQFSLTFEKNHMALAEAAQSLVKILPPNGPFKYWLTWHVYLSHATTFLQNLGDCYERDIIEIAEICWYMADYFRQIARYTDVEALAQRSVRIHIALLGEENLNTAGSMRTLASIYLQQEKFEKAEQLLSKVIVVYESLLGYEHEKVQNTIICLSMVILAQGRRKEAEDLQLKLVDSCHRIFGAKHRQTFLATNVLGLIYQEQGRYKEAGEILKMLEDCAGVLGEEQPFHMARLASMYLEQGQGEKAEELYVKSLEIQRRELGKEHPDTLESMLALASVYQTQARYEETETLYTKTLEIRQRVLGEERPDTIRCIGCLADTYARQDRHEEAEALCTKIVEIRQRVLGEEHPDTIVCMEDLAFVYSLQDQHKEAEELYMKVLDIQQRVLGGKHPDTLASTVKLACVYEDQGRYEEAEELYTKSLEIQQRVLGEEHPDTIDCMEDLAGAYEKQDRHEASEDLYIKVLEIRQRTQGKDHESTLPTMCNLSLVYCATGQTKEAADLQSKILQATKRVQDAEHPETLHAMISLASTYHDLEKYDDAISILKEVIVLGSSVHDCEKVLECTEMSKELLTRWHWMDSQSEE
jgi:tetratricopeptide (TPR) repeat protein